MGISLGAEQAAGTAPPGRGLRRLLGALDSPTALRRLALGSVVVNVLIVVTGGAVRLTDSGLGCPTWPACSGSDPIPTHEFGIHKAIEFGNRTLTFVVGAVVLLTLVSAWRQHREARLALLAFLGVPAQAVLGGIVVLTDLNPWLVALHFLLSAGIVAVTFLLWWRLAGRSAAAVTAPRSATLLARGLAALAAGVLALGTIVTGTGPHAGDPDQNGRIHRIHLSTAAMTQLHADAVMVLIGASVGMLALTYALHLAAPVRKAAAVLVAVELAQGIIGFTQYLLHVPALLVVFHMFGACLVWLAALTLLLLLEPAAGRVTAPG
ncbi:MAG: heme a synthase [Pseudonocardiales bacterium]|jgi:cytochrome c oxidase assembly protein subunit 15|nr:heme a synthase [Pseudonocardiales bacterium]